MYFFKSKCTVRALPRLILPWFRSMFYDLLLGVQMKSEFLIGSNDNSISLNIDNSMSLNMDNSMSLNMDDSMGLDIPGFIESTDGLVMDTDDLVSSINVTYIVEFY